MTEIDRSKWVLGQDGYQPPPEEQPRKATDVLLSLENKVETLTKLVANQDMLLKIIANRTNSIFSYIEELKKEYQEQVVAQAKATQSEDQEEEPKIVSSPAPEQVITEADLSKQVGEKRGMRAPSPEQEKMAAQDGRKVPVMQRVSDSTGKDLFMSQVVISDESGKEVYKTKTNAVGKWQASLKPGQYTVHISKTNTVNKKVLEGTQKITVNNSSSTITLPVAIIKE